MAWGGSAALSIGGTRLHGTLQAVQSINRSRARRVTDYPVTTRVTCGTLCQAGTALFTLPGPADLLVGGSTFTYF